jgi:heptose-I-phosphate ethanolaminephosphotransferase
MNFLKNIISSLKEIFPKYLILLVLSPIILGFFIDYELSDSRYFLLNLIWLQLFTIPLILTKKKFFYYFAASIYFLIGFIEITHWIILKGPITITSLLVISNTNFQEANEFFDLKASIGLLLLIPYFLLFVFSLRTNLELKTSKFKNYLIVFLAFVSIIFISENIINQRFIRKGIPHFTKMVFTFIDEMQLYNEAMQITEPKQINAKTSFTENTQTFVIILGESCNRKHMSLYGAKQKTNPKLEKRNDIFVFNDVVSAYSNTIRAVLSILTDANIENKIQANKSIDMIDIFHSAGFKTYWLSNQTPVGIWDNHVTIFAKKSDVSKFVNTTSNTSFEATNNISLDDKLFKPFSKILNEKTEKKFIVLHLMGSHSTYSKRYPSEFNKFENNNSKKERTIAEFENSLLYNDYIVDSLLNMLKSKSKNQTTSVIYLSDHGENVYDENDNVGHDFSKNLPKANVEIPFIVWLSPKYIELNSEKLETIKLNLNKPYVSDDLFHSIIDLNGIKTSYFEEKRSIFNSNFNANRKRILEDGNDYDAK